MFASRRGARISVESMMDELARASGQDPLPFRLADMEDPRARAVMTEATNRFGWAKRVPGDGRHGCGMGFARYKNIGAYCAVLMEVELERETGRITVRRVEAAVDAGQPASIDGIRNQIEGGIVQSLSWTTRETVAFDANHRTSLDWSGDQISRFSDVPGGVNGHVLPQPGLPFWAPAKPLRAPRPPRLPTRWRIQAGSVSARCR
jgi:CO/xanthine dehydrogenase Mo-binding subunit